ncbi:pyridoxamine 5'-phosphate oxidase family protein [Actinopolyspora mortivallis]|uniref:Pyridoxamine 5-phosphate oxidase n=1 Tax=Actinopolyspora mortivallis TaxID=33906 RepID=A0A2T0H0P7_ACTMO|nr:pyridoxamine 5'-phosphate oxidase family protein [Actinopolyspora mortivallis]PRW64910.1 pyridoxamine 5-phosphate oxidase [Actinopolyspora mortivallis]
MSRFARLAFTETVRLLQQEEGTRPRQYRDLGEAVGRHPDPLGERETEFIANRDGFYLASVGETGWPYVQFRGGPPGFVHVLDEHTLGYADVRGNREYITNGNLRADGRVALFFMDYPRRTRLKLFGHAATHGLQEDPELAERLCAPRTDGRVERTVLISVEGYDWNCPKHIPRRYTEEELAPLHERIRRLEAENAELRARLGGSGG